MDSVALFHLCLGSKIKNKIFAVHVNHELRAKSKTDQLFVEDLCLKHNVPLFVKRNHVEIKNGESTEMWARRIRYNAFIEGKSKFDCDYIITAHHANDLVETIIMQLNNGCGIEGLRGIPKINKPYFRPLLGYKKSSIKNYILKNKINYVVDERNNDISIKRNYVRKKILLPWETQANNIIDRFISLSSKAINSINYMNMAIDKISNDIESINGQIIIPNKLAKILSPTQFVRLIKKLIGETSISWRRYQWESFIQWILNSNIGSKYNINDYCIILKDRKCFIINSQFTSPIEIEIQKEGEYEFKGIRLIINKTNEMVKSKNPFVEIIDRRLLSKKSLKLRTWRAGDRFKPLGMKGNKKISDFLVDIKMNRFDKEKQLVLTADDEIIWLCGQRISDKVKVTNKTSNFMKLSIACQS